MHLAITNMESLLLWQILTFVVGSWATYSGYKTLRMSNEDYLQDLEQIARKNARNEGKPEQEEIRRFVDPERKDSMQTYRGGGMLGIGIVLLFAFVLLILLDIGT
jgi:hypothetical protein